MQTIIIMFDPEKLENPDLDLTYALPVRIEEYTDNIVYDNGYDYVDGDVIAMWLETENAETGAEKVIELIKAERIVDNDLSKTVEILISEEDCAEIDKCRKIFP
ncbi:hypothetical protein [Ruminococcus albus]|uniref:Uncharacterized protein n=1 Tax=Ruminococcus albus TaxID=1264 RepID=A0A1I1N192_RUMAL|nr:hypothetical protein [Ruminococcus albus]SFC89248.1 hypothetical protein SAMN02910406_02601 [Ruminococcus albus]